MSMKQAVRIGLGLVVFDLGLIVVSGGVSLLGQVEPTGFLLRLFLALVGIVVSHRLGKTSSAQLHGYLALLLCFLSLLHFFGFRLRGDGLWYYSYAHSIAFDRDINLTNQYQSLGIDHQRGSQVVPETGYARYTYPMGVALAWIPYIEVGHLGVWLRNFHGLQTSYDGYSDPYFHAVALGSLLMGWAGLLVLDGLLRRWFPPTLAFVASVSTAMGSFFLWYLVYHSISTHALTFLLATLILERWVDQPERARDFAVLGLLVGMAACVRWQTAVLGLLPAFSLVVECFRKRWRYVLTGAAALAGAFLLGVLPQIVSWKTIFGSFWIGVPLGPDYMSWSAPFLSEILFSSRHGLFSWSPLLFFAAVGLVGFAFRRPKTGVPLLVMVALLTYINSAVSDWWAGGSFGARRFDSVLPMLAIGLATTIAWGVEHVRRRPVITAVILLGVFVGGNLLFMEQYRKGRIPSDDTISWEEAGAGMMEDVFDAVGYPFSFPANWAFALEYNRPKTQYDLLVGKYLFHFLNEQDGEIDLGIHDPPYLGNGWSSITDWEGRSREIRLATGQRAGIFVPLHQPEALRIKVECATPRGIEPLWVETWLNGFRLGGFRPGTEMEEISFTAAKRGWKRINLLEFVPEETDPKGAYLAVDRIRFEQMNEPH